MVEGIPRAVAAVPSEVVMNKHEMLRLLKKALDADGRSTPAERLARLWAGGRVDERGRIVWRRAKAPEADDVHCVKGEE